MRVASETSCGDRPRNSRADVRAAPMSGQYCREGSSVGANVSAESISPERYSCVTPPESSGMATDAPKYSRHARTRRTLVPLGGDFLMQGCGYQNKTRNSIL